MRNSGIVLATCVVSKIGNVFLTGKLLILPYDDTFYQLGSILLTTSPITSTDLLGLPTSVPLTYAQRAPGSPVMSE